MVTWELDSFLLKFKNLLCAEKDATLTFRAEAGRVSVSLSVDLGHVLSDQGQLPPCGPRNGPARQRRREQRAAARAKKASTETVVPNDAKSTEEVEEAPATKTKNSAAVKAKESEKVVKANEPDDF